MFDFSVSDFHKKSYIIGYDVNYDENNIIIYYADGREVVKDYSVKEEINTLNIMKKNVFDCYNNYLDIIKEEYENSDEINSIKLEFMASLCLLSLVCLPGSLSMDLFKILFGGISLEKLLELVNSFKYSLSNKEYIEEYQKYLYFLDNIEFFDDNDVLDDKHVIKSLSKSALKYLKTADFRDDVPVINLNSIDVFSLNDLKVVKKGFEYSQLSKKLFYSN